MDIYGADPEKYIEFMSILNCCIAEKDDRVYEVACGILTLIFSKECEN